VISWKKKKIREIIDDSGTSLICMNKKRNDKRCYARMFFLTEVKKKWERSIIKQIADEEKQQETERKEKDDDKGSLAVIIIG
jgi:hypothetical protein